MNYIFKSHCESGNFSHGYLLIGEREKARDSARKAAAILLNCEESFLDLHPDFSENFFESFGIDESQELKQKFFMKPVSGEKKVFLIGASYFSAEISPFLSQSIENSPDDCYFFFLTLSMDEAPIVLRSKLINVFEEKNAELIDDKKIFYEKFLKSDSMERLALVKDAAGDKKKALEFINELEIILKDFLEKFAVSQLEKDKNILENIVSSMGELKEGRQFLFSRAPYPKMIIEHFALTLPQLK